MLTCVVKRFDWKRTLQKCYGKAVLSPSLLMALKVGVKDTIQKMSTITVTVLMQIWIQTHIKYYLENIKCIAQSPQRFDLLINGF